ncbi:hypothetical protein B0T11DRAFT_64647 [Plectosphaerella cucumerina]|uniref:Uncharacterized protein n=1 Tax=Plectosphaerella cucumerina TaxID=40658 RepID=A0A8K0TSC5_9PEZI|nr:hypothetical protein B0T11DRAFT_64647 [Plectosphaerella cucumerina]
MSQRHINSGNTSSFHISPLEAENPSASFSQRDLPFPSRLAPITATSNFTSALHQILSPFTPKLDNSVSRPKYLCLKTTRRPNTRVTHTSPSLVTPAQQQQQDTLPPPACHVSIHHRPVQVLAHLRRIPSRGAVLRAAQEHHGQGEGKQPGRVGLPELHGIDRCSGLLLPRLPAGRPRSVVPAPGLQRPPNVADGTANYRSRPPQGNVGRQTSSFHTGAPFSTRMETTCKGRGP